MGVEGGGAMSGCALMVPTGCIFAQRLLFLLCSFFSSRVEYSTSEEKKKQTNQQTNDARQGHANGEAVGVACSPSAHGRDPIRGRGGHVITTRDRRTGPKRRRWGRPRLPPASLRAVASEPKTNRFIFVRAEKRRAKSIRNWPVLTEIFWAIILPPSTASPVHRACPKTAPSVTPITSWTKPSITIHRQWTSVHLGTTRWKHVHQ